MVHSTSTDSAATPAATTADTVAGRVRKVSVDSDEYRPFCAAPITMRQSDGTVVSHLPAGEVVTLPLDVQWAFLLQIAYALEGIHAKGIVHKDLKTENILVTDQDPCRGRAVIADLGMAQRDTMLLRADGVEETEEVQAGMKDLWWASPEECQEHGAAAGAAVTAQSDVFAFGLIGAHITSGVLPWETQRIMGHSGFDEVQVYIKTGRTAEFVALPTDSPFAPLLRECWHLEPTQRPTAAVLVQRLLDLAPACFSDNHLAAVYALKDFHLTRLLHGTRVERALSVPSVVARGMVPIPDDFRFSFQPRADCKHDDDNNTEEEEKAEKKKREQDTPATASFCELPELVEYFMNVTVQKAQLLLILGDGGMGKSLMLEQVALQYPQAFPLRLLLPASEWSRSGLRDAVPRALQQGYGLSEAMVRAMQAQSHVFLVDALDEVADDMPWEAGVSLRKLLGLTDWPLAKLIVTSRPQAVTDTRASFLDMPGGVWRRYILPFCRAQAEQYVRLRLRGNTDVDTTAATATAPASASSSSNTPAPDKVMRQKHKHKRIASSSASSMLSDVPSELWQNPLVLRLYASCSAEVRHTARIRSDVYAAVVQDWCSELLALLPAAVVKDMCDTTTQSARSAGVESRGTKGATTTAVTGATAASAASSLKAVEESMIRWAGQYAMRMFTEGTVSARILARRRGASLWTTPAMTVQGGTVADVVQLWDTLEEHVLVAARTARLADIQEHCREQQPQQQKQQQQQRVLVSVDQFASLRGQQVSSVLSRCPLKRGATHTYTFVHKSFQEYLVARLMAAQLCLAAKVSPLSTAQVESLALSQRLLSADVAVLRFAAEQVRGDRTVIWEYLLSRTHSLAEERRLLPSPFMSARVALGLPRLRGWVLKRGQLVKSWRKRFVVVYRGILRYFEDDNMANCKGMFGLAGAGVERVTHVDKGDCIQVRVPVGSGGKIRAWLAVPADTQRVDTWVRFVEAEARWVDMYTEQQSVVVMQDAAQCGECHETFRRMTRMRSVSLVFSGGRSDVTKQHCQSCGGVFHNKCCNYSIPLPHLRLNEPQRVCQSCFRFAVSGPVEVAPAVDRNKGHDHHTVPLETRDDDDIKNEVSPSYSTRRNSSSARGTSIHVDGALTVATPSTSGVSATAAATTSTSPCSCFSRGLVELVLHACRCTAPHSSVSLAVRTACANAVSILNVAAVPLSAADLSCAQLSFTAAELAAQRAPYGVDLGGAMMHSCKLRCANLSGGSLQQACLDACEIPLAHLKHMRMGQAPTLKGHLRCVNALVLSPDGCTLYSGSSDHCIKQWDLSDGSCTRTLEGHTGWVLALALSPDGHALFSGSYDKTIKQWDVRDGSCMRTLEGHMDSVYALALSPHGRTLYSGSSDGRIKQWSLRKEASCTCTMTGHTNAVNVLVVTADGSTLFSGSWDCSIKQWNIRVPHGRCIRTLEGHSSTVNALALSPDDRTLYSGSYDKSIKHWNLADGSCTRTLQGHTSYVVALAVSPDGRTLFSGSGDMSIKHWNLSDGLCMRSLQGHTGSVFALALTTDGLILFSGSYDKTIKQWNLSDGSCTRELQGHTNLVLALTLSSDGCALFSGSNDKTIRQWNLRDGSCTHALLGHTGGVTALCLTPDDSTLWSSSNDKSIKQWNLQDGTCADTLSATAQTDAPTNIALVDGKRHIVRGSMTWRVSEDNNKQIVQLCDTPYLSQPVQVWRTAPLVLSARAVRGLDQAHCSKSLQLLLREYGAAGK